MINESAIKGEAGTGFEKRGTKGDFDCGNCQYFNGKNACNQEDMKKVSKQPRHPNGTVVVGPGDCCEYVERLGKPQAEENLWLRTHLVSRIEMAQAA